MFDPSGNSRTFGSFGFSQNTFNSESTGQRRISANLPEQTRFFDVCLFIVWVIASLLLIKSTDSEGSGSSDTPSGLGALGYLVAFAVVIVERRTAVSYLRGSLPLVLILLVAGLSAVFSETPAYAAVQSLHLIGSSFIALALVCRLGLKGFLKMLVVLTMIEATLSVALIIALPQLGIMNTGEWQGMFWNKNGLGAAMLVGMIAVACVGDGLKRPAYQVPAFVFFLTLLIGSRSGTPLVAATVVALAYPFALWCRGRQNRKLLFGALALPVVAVSLIGIVTDNDLSTLLTVVGKDPTLTGRTDLWQDLLTAIAYRPFLGYGYGVYWSPDGPAAGFLSKAVAWDPGEAHNGYLDVALNTGIVGVALLFFFLAVALRRAFAMFWSGRDGLAAWPLLMTVSMIIINFSETQFEHAHSDLWIMAIVAFLFATGARNEARAIPVHESVA